MKIRESEEFIEKKRRQKLVEVTNKGNNTKL